MKTEHTSLRQSLYRGVFTAILVLAVLAPLAYAANFTSHRANPPQGNPPALINLGLTSQTKIGDFWADAIGATDGFCIGENCITSWPWTPPPAVCKFETLIKQGNYWIPGTDPYDSTPVGQGCTQTPTEIAEGWILTAFDHCSWVASRDCAGPSWCKFTKLTCTGSVTVEPGTLYRGTPYYTQGYYQGYYQSGYEGGYEGGYGGDGGEFVPSFF